MRLFLLLIAGRRLPNPRASQSDRPGCCPVIRGWKCPPIPALDGHRRPLVDGSDWNPRKPYDLRHDGAADQIDRPEARPDRHDDARTVTLPGDTADRFRARAESDLVSYRYP